MLQSLITAIVILFASGCAVGSGHPARSVGPIRDPAHRAPPAGASEPARGLTPPALAELPRLTAKQALRDLRIAQRALTELHPGLFRYLTPDGLASELARARAAVADGADLATMYLWISRITAAVRCGHTWTNVVNQPELVQRALFGRADKLPVQLRMVARRMLVTGSADPAIAAGSELLAIDDRPPAVLVAEMMPYLRADGSNDGKRLAQLDHGDGGGAMDRLFPLLHPPQLGRYRLSLRTPAGITEQRLVTATTTAQRDAAIAATAGRTEDLEWSFVIAGDTGVLTLPTFAFWNSSFDWKAFLDRAFADLQSRAIPYLIIDQRRNEGGDGAIVDAVLSHLLTAPFHHPARRAEVAYERVPYDLARFLDTWDFGFFDRTGKVSRQPGRNFLYPAASTRGELVRPVAQPYRGRTFVLIGPDNSSAGFLLAAMIKSSRAATLIGQSSGGNQRGLNGGELAWITLPESGVSFDIPLVAWMPLGDEPDAGIAPDLEVVRNFAQVASGIDAEMTAAREQIAKLRGGN
jgi:Peptidase family S41